MPAPVHVFVCHTGALDAGRVSRLAALLSVQERERYAALGLPDDRRDFAAAHAMLRLALAERLGAAPHEVSFGVDARGKPFVAAPRAGADTTPAFSLSHSRGVVGCALGGRSPVGIDVERVDGSLRVLEIARRYLSPEEARALEQLPTADRTLRFFDLWTLKESLAKAGGVELQHALRQHVFRVTAHGVSAAHASGWSFIVGDVGGTHRLAVVARGRATLDASVIDPLALARGTLRALWPWPAADQRAETSSLSTGFTSTTGVPSIASR